MSRLPIVLALVAGCASPVSSSSPPVAQASQEIIGGSAATDDNAVVMLASYPGDMSVLATCSAVLVAPTVLLTAAHCVDAANHPSYTYGVFPDQDGSPYTTLAELAPHLLPVASVHPDPGYQATPPYQGDLGIVVLASALPGVTPLPLNRTALDSAVVGMAARIVGYGQTVYGTANQTRNAAMTTVASIDAQYDTIVVGDSTHVSCLGDSGGPAIVGGKVIALDSYTDTSGCTEPAHYTRTDLYAAFIDTYAPAPAADAGVPDTTEAGMGSDPGGSNSGGGGCDAGGGGSAALLPIALALCALRRRYR